MWLNKTEVDIWRNSQYPTSLDEQPTITYDNDIVTLEMGKSNINDFTGMITTSLFMLVGFILCYCVIIFFNTIINK